MKARVYQSAVENISSLSENNDIINNQLQKVSNKLIVRQKVSNKLIVRQKVILKNTTRIDRECGKFSFKWLDLKFLRYQITTFVP